MASNTDTSSNKRRRRKPADPEPDTTHSDEAEPTESAQEANASLQAEHATTIQQERSRDLARVIRALHNAEWLGSPGAQHHLANLQEELEHLRDEAEDHFWGRFDQKQPSGKEIAEYRARHRVLSGQVAQFRQPHLGVTEKIHVAMAAERERRAEYPMVVTANPLPWENTEAEWMRAAEAIRRGTLDHPYPEYADAEPEGQPAGEQQGRASTSAA